MNKPTTQAERLQIQLQHRTEHLLSLVDDFFVGAPASEYIEVLLTYYSYWSADLYEEQQQGYKPDQPYQVSGAALDRVQTLMRLMHFLTVLSETYSQIELVQKTLNPTQQS